MSSGDQTPVTGYLDGRWQTSEGHPSPEDRRLTRRERLLSGRPPLERSIERTKSRLRTYSDHAGPQTPQSASSESVPRTLSWDPFEEQPTYSSTRRFSSLLGWNSTYDVPPRTADNSNSSTTGVFGATLLDRALRNVLNNLPGANADLDDTEEDVFASDDETESPDAVSDNTVLAADLTESSGNSEQFVAADSSITDNMPAAQQIAECKSTLAALSLVIEDEIDATDPLNTTPEYLVSKIELAEQWKVKARDAIVFLQANDAEVYESNFAATATTNRRKLVDFTKSAMAVLKDIRDRDVTQVNNAAAAQAKAREIKANSVLKYTDSTVQNIDKLASELDDMILTNPTSDHEYRQFESECTAMMKKVGAAKEDCKALYNAAVEAGLGTQADTLETNIRRLKDKSAAVDEHLLENKQKFGMAERGSGAGRYASDITPPIFKGDFSSKEDYYVWKREFDEYVKVKCLTRDETLRILLTKSLDGDAKLACTNMKESKDVFQYLQATYGNVRLLLERHMACIKELGKCEGNDDEQRRWCLNVRAKLQYAESLAVQHGLKEHLYNSSIVEEARLKLPYKLQDKYVESMREKSGGGLLDRGDMFKELSNLLFQHHETLTFKINNGMSVLKKPEKKPAPEQASSKPKPQTKGAGAKRGYAVQEVEDDHGGARRGGDKRGAGAGKKSGKNATSDGAKPKTVAAAKSYVAKEADCRLCNGRHTHLYYCQVYRDAEVRKRYKLVYDVGICFRCLACESTVNFKDRAKWWESHAASCYTKFPCRVGGCKEKPDRRQNNISLCKWHEDENAALEADLIRSLDQSLVDSTTKFFFFNPIHTTWTGVHGVGKPVQGWDVLPDIADPPIFLLETIIVNGSRLLIFYDSGCQTASISERAAAILDTETVRAGPSQVSVAGGEVIDIPGGEERFTLPLRDGKRRATITALCMPSVTTEFPTWDLAEAQADIEKGWKQDMGGKPMPKLPRSVGGCTVDIMLGIQYFRWFPRILYVLESGLAIHESMFLSAEDCRGVLGGPHPSFRKAAEWNHTVHRVYNQKHDAPDLLEHVPVVQDLVEDPEDAVEPVCEHQHCSKHQQVDTPVPLQWTVGQVHNFSIHETPKDKILKFLESDEIGSDISYRCPACRNCAKCRNGDTLEAISLKSEQEQALIESCVSYNPELKKVSARLPFLVDPEEALKPNFHIAEKIFKTQIKLANKDDSVKAEIVKAHSKLADKGFVCAVEDLPTDVRAKVEALTGYVIPWRTVCKQNSLSTPTRMVFDGSSRTPGGESLNSTLAKGVNTLGNLYNLLIQFRLNKYAFTTDISLAYNNISMDPDHVAYQKYLWRENLDEGNELKVWVILSQIYGIRSSGNITIRGFQVLADHARASHKNLELGAAVLHSEAYMDDILSSHPTEQQMLEASKQLLQVLELGQMKVKALTYVGTKPDETVSADGRTVGLLGMCWDPVADEITLDIKDLFFGKVRRGKRPDPVTGDIAAALKGNFTKRTLLSKVAGLYDPLGLLTPFSARLKLDLQNVVKLGIDWDQTVPQEFFQTWVENLEEMQDMKGTVISRTVIPHDAADVNLSYIFSSDASKHLAVATVHTRIKKLDGTYHVSLLTAKSKLTTKLTIPRGELRACLMSSSLSFCVRQLSGQRLRDCIYVTDSAICLYWIQSDERPLQTAVRNGVIEIRRLSDLNAWYHVRSEDNVADIGTRTDVEVDYKPEGEWFSGKPWMKLEIHDMPIKTMSELTLNCEERRQAALETKNPDIQGIVLSSLKTKVAERYQSSNYLLDPCRYSWEKCLRILALVFRCLDKCTTWTRPWFPDGEVLHSSGLAPSESEIARATNYYFSIASAEVKIFANKSDLKDSFVKNEILHYNGRILEGQEIENHLGEGLDVEPLMFCRPIVDRHSPVAYAVMTHAHVNLARHGNSCATLRESRGIAYILHGRSLAEEIRKKCPHCTRYKARLLERSMGKVHDNRLVIAPPFFYAQCDLFGPMVATCEHNHRSKVKVYGCVFKCTSSCAVAVYCLQDYSTPAVVQAYTRFAARYGHPSKLWIDPGSQLVAACKSMEISAVDLETALTVKHKVGLEFEMCPPGAHHHQGMVERSIKEIKKVFQVVFGGLKLDILSYETAFSFVANELNNFPVCLGSKTECLNKLDVITPNRLIVGRNNRAALSGQPDLNQPASRLIKQNRQVEESWWAAWTDLKINDFIPKPSKWQRDWGTVQVGDIVIFKRAEQALGAPVFRLARVVEIYLDKDDRVRRVKVEYKNSSENVFRNTVKDVKQIAKLHSDTDLVLVDALNESQRLANLAYIQAKGD